jgi:hypothetical protein
MFRDSRRLSSLVPQSPHNPTGYEQAAHEHDEAVEAITDLVAGIVTHRDAEDDGRKDGKQKGSIEVREGERGH